MDTTHARRLVADYTEGWRTGDAQRVLGTLAGDCIVIESHGPTFSGRAEIAHWLRDWRERGSTVQRWDLLSFVHAGETAAVEWHFECTDRDVRYDIEGASVFTFAGDRIHRIAEYRRTDRPRPGLTA